VKKILFIFILMVTLIPFQVFGENSESAGGYKFSYDDRKSKYSFGDGHYIIIPDNIVVDSRDFSFFNVIETDISLDMIRIDNEFDIQVDNNMDVIFIVKYKDIGIRSLAKIKIEEYLRIEEEIMVKDYNFDLWEHIDTNLVNKEEIEIIGEYDLNNNGKYGIVIKYKELVANTVIVVDIEDNKEIEVIEKTCPNETLTYETKNYTSNYYDYHYYTEEESDDIKEVTCNNIPTPINRIIYSEQEQNNNIFYYISYTFYFLTIVLLSINVVRKK